VIKIVCAYGQGTIQIKDPVATMFEQVWLPHQDIRYRWDLSDFNVVSRFRNLPKREQL
jgi:hypothetical protein